MDDCEVWFGKARVSLSLFVPACTPSLVTQDLTEKEKRKNHNPERKQLPESMVNMSGKSQVTAACGS